MPYIDYNKGQVTQGGNLAADLEKQKKISTQKAQELLSQLRTTAMNAALAHPENADFIMKMTDLSSYYPMTTLQGYGFAPMSAGVNQTMQSKYFEDMKESKNRVLTDPVYTQAARSGTYVWNAENPNDQTDMMRRSTATAAYLAQSGDTDNEARKVYGNTLIYEDYARRQLENLRKTQGNSNDPQVQARMKSLETWANVIYPSVRSAAFQALREEYINEHKGEFDPEDFQDYLKTKKAAQRYNDLWREITSAMLARLPKNVQEMLTFYHPTNFRTHWGTASGTAVGAPPPNNTLDKIKNPDQVPEEQRRREGVEPTGEVVYNRR